MDDTPVPDTDPLDERPTAEQLTSDFKSLFDELRVTTTELARRMRYLGDHRSVDTIVRSIQRMLSGDVGVSGEMMVIATMLKQQWILRDSKYEQVEWKRLKDGSYSALESDFVMTLQPQTKARWKVNLIHTKSGYSPAWPTWQPTLEEAKRKAITCLLDAQVQVAELGST